jgi:hypothetical protein
MEPLKPYIIDGNRPNITQSAPNQEVSRWAAMTVSHLLGKV